MTKSRLQYSLAVGLILLVQAVAKRQLPGRKGARRDQTTAKLARHRMHLYYRLLRYVFLSLLAPAIISFVYSVARDPAVPLLLRELIAAVKRRFSKSLSSTTTGQKLPPQGTSFISGTARPDKIH